MKLRNSQVLHRLRDGKTINAMEFYSEGMVSFSQVCQRWPRYDKNVLIYLACHYLEMYTAEDSYKDIDGRIFHIGQNETDKILKVTPENIKYTIESFLDTDYADYGSFSMKKIMVKLSDIEEIEQSYPDLLCSPVQFGEIEQQEDTELSKIQNENRALKTKIEELKKQKAVNTEAQTTAATKKAKIKNADDWKKCLKEAIFLFCKVCERGDENFTAKEFKNFAKENDFYWTNVQYDTLRKALPFFLVKKDSGVPPK